PRALGPRRHNLDISFERIERAVDANVARKVTTKRPFRDEIVDISGCQLFHRGLGFDLHRLALGNLAVPFHARVSAHDPEAFYFQPFLGVARPPVFEGTLQTKLWLCRRSEPRRNFAHFDSRAGGVNADSAL